VTLLDAMADDALFARQFGREWDAWRTFLKACFGLPLSPEERALYATCTQRQTPPTSPVREAWVCAGRRAGKSRVAALIAVYLACFRDYADVLASGEVATLPLIASDRRQARVAQQYIAGLVDEVPMLAHLVVGRTAEAIEFATGVRIEIHTASWRSLRGYSIAACVADEICFWHSEDSANPDTEIVASIRPAMVTIPGSLLVAISSPYARRGVMWETFRRHHGDQGDPAILTWQAPSRTMNGTIPQSVVDEALAADEAAARAEWLAEWRRDVDAFVSREVLDACVVPGRTSLPRLRDFEYHAFVDPSGGSQDSFTVAVAHAEREHGQVVAVLDHVEERRPPFSPEQVVREFAETVKRYGGGRVVGDRYGGEWPREQFRKAGVEYACAEKPKSDLYREVLPMFSSGRVRLLDLPRLLAQFLNLERRTARGGRDTIDHAPHAHDDLSNAAAGALVHAASGAASDVEVLSANVNPERNRRVLDDGEMAWMRRII
jgi:hypothetical protein